jgi:hypothetical protein
MRRNCHTRECCAIEEKIIRGKLTKPINVGRRRFQELEAFTAAK